ncbi:MAG: DUF1840 domain-containing protein [Gammaproteobacteria bacterium]|nr:DUF1840 domain-containing protein [Gammaproteobacteria bacterium]
MPITFKSKYSPDVLMLEAVARELIHLMGHSGSVPGSLAAEDIPAALANLERAIGEGPGRALDADRRRDEDEDRRDKPVSVAHRAGPLLAMLKTALKEREHVLWER